MKGTVFTQRHQKTAGGAGGVLILGLRTSDDVIQSKKTGIHFTKTNRQNKQGRPRVRHLENRRCVAMLRGKHTTKVLGNRPSLQSRHRVPLNPDWQRGRS